MVGALAFFVLVLASRTPSFALRVSAFDSWAGTPGADGDVAQIQPVSVLSSPEPCMHPLDRPWWAPKSGALRSGSMSRRIKRAFQRRLRLTPGLLKLVLEQVPISFSLVATLAVTPDGWMVFVWELAVSPGGKIPGVYAEMINRLRQRVPEWLMATPDAPQFVPGSETLVTSVPDGDAKHAVFWDVRSGRALLTVAGAEIVTVSRGSGLAVGTAVPGNYTMHPAIWNTSSGTRLSQAVSPHEPQYWCSDAVFSPGGGTIAALLKSSVIHTNDPFWRIAVYNSSSGDKFCDFSTAMLDDSYTEIPPATTFAYDGGRIAICRGSDQAAVLLDVRWVAGHCELVQRALNSHCNDVYMFGRVRLEISGREVRIVRSDDGEEDELVCHAEIAGLKGRSVGFFSPDGLKVLVCCWGLCYVWAFADGGEPKRVELVVSYLTFTADSAAILGIAADSSEAICFDLDGRLVLRFGGDVDELTGLATGEVTDW